MSDQVLQNTSDLAAYMSKQYPSLKQNHASAFIRTLFATIARSLRQQIEAGVSDPHVQIYGFGNIHTTTRQPRRARNPRTGEDVEVGIRHGLKWSPSVNLKKFINGDGEEFFPRVSTSGFDTEDSYQEENTDNYEEFDGTQTGGFTSHSPRNSTSYATRTKRMPSLTRNKTVNSSAPVTRKKRSVALVSTPSATAKRGPSRTKSLTNISSGSELKRGPGRPKGSVNKAKLVGQSSTRFSNKGPALKQSTPQPIRRRSANTGSSSYGNKSAMQYQSASTKGEPAWMREARKNGWNPNG